MKRRFVMSLIIAGILTTLFSLAIGQTKISNTIVPLPPSEASLPIIGAQPWFQIDPGPKVFLEGPAFDREGNLFISSIFDSRIFKITPDKKVSTILNIEGLLPDGIAIHKDGRLFVVCLSKIQNLLL